MYLYPFTASSATLGLPSSALDVSCFPREPIHVGALERVVGGEQITATVLPQLSAGPAANSSTSTVQLLEWTEAVAPPPGSGLRVSACGDWLAPLAASVGRGLRWKRGGGLRCWDLWGGALNGGFWGDALG